jgi:hypothetical protein
MQKVEALDHTGPLGQMRRKRKMRMRMRKRRRRRR